MKKIIFVLLTVLAFGFTACGSDDDGAKTCEACSITNIVSFNICDNGNGTADVTITAAGITTTNTESFDEGQTFEEFVSNRCVANITF